MLREVMVSRLAPEPEGVDVHQVRSVDLGRGVTGERERQFVGRDAAPVVGHPDQGTAAVGHLDRDAPGTRVDGVLDQLLDRRGWAFHDLAGRDPVDRSLVQLPDGRTRLAYLGVEVLHPPRPSTSRADSATRPTGALTLSIFGICVMQL
jgi:hypothetical protein